VVASIFLPVSFLASLFGITTVTWPAIWYLWSAIPIVIVSILFTLLFPWSVRQVQKLLYPVEELRIPLQPSSFTMLGDELPDNVDVPGANRRGRVTRKVLRPTAVDAAKGRSRSRRRNSEKLEEGDYF